MTASFLQRWFLDGQVTCFHDSLHIVLGILAILGVILLSLMIPALCIFTLVGKSSRLKVGIPTHNHSYAHIG